MKILGFLPESFQDWDAGLTSVIFTGSCNYKCPACHAGSLVRSKEVYAEEDILRRLERKKNYIKRVSICGGEPTLQYDLPIFLKKLKTNNFLVKLDTNGSNPNVLEEVINDKLVDYVAMDIKGPPSLYRRIIGLEGEDENEEMRTSGRRFDFRDNLEKAIGIVQKAPDYEFRTTLFPVYTDNKHQEVRWMTKPEALEMAEYVQNFIPGDPKGVKWYIQKFTARPKEIMIDPRFSKENLPSEFLETPENVMLDFQAALRTKFPNAVIR